MALGLLVLSGCNGHGGNSLPQLGSQGARKGHQAIRMHPHNDQTFHYQGMSSYNITGNRQATQPLGSSNGQVWYVNRNASSSKGVGLSEISMRGGVTNFRAPGTGVCITNFALNAAGMAAALDDCNGKVYTITTTGAYKSYAYPMAVSATSGLSYQGLPAGAVVGSDGSFYFINGSSGAFSLEKMTMSNGTFTSLGWGMSVVNPSDAPASLIVGPDKALYGIVEGGKVYKIVTGTTPVWSSYQMAAFPNPAGIESLVSWKGLIWAFGIDGNNEYTLSSMTTSGASTNVWQNMGGGNLQLMNSTSGNGWAVAGKDGNLYLGLCDANGDLEIWKVVQSGTSPSFVYNETLVDTIPGNSGSPYNGAALGADGNFWLAWQNTSFGVFENYSLNADPSSFSFTAGYPTTQILRMTESASGGAIAATSENTGVATVTASSAVFPGIFFVTAVGQGVTIIDVKDAQKNTMSIPVSVNLGGVAPTANLASFTGSLNNGSFNAGTSANTVGFSQPVSPSVDLSGNLYVADLFGGQSALRTVPAAGFPGSNVSTGDFGQGTAVDLKGNVYYAAGPENVIQKNGNVDPTNVVAGNTCCSGATNGAGSVARFRSPLGLATDRNGNVYIADVANCMIRKMTPAYAVSTLAGHFVTPGVCPTSADGTGTAAGFNNPQYVAVDMVRGLVYVADGTEIRKITSTGAVTTFAGGTNGHVDGFGTAALFNAISGMAADFAGNIYVTETTPECDLRMITPEGEVSTIAGTPGTCSSYMAGNPLSITFGNPEGVAVDRYGNIFVVDQGHTVIDKITP